jgi:hypothetical protein
MTVNPGIETPTQVETWELTLPEDEAKCEFPGGCNAAPTWAFIPACGCSTPMCDPHHDIQDAEAHRVDALYGGGRCKMCKSLVDTWHWIRI